MVKRIYLEPTFKMHPYFRELVLHPPEGYEFVVDEGLAEKVYESVSQMPFAYWLMGQIYKTMPVTLVKSYVERFFKKIPAGVELTFSFGHLVFRREPWVIELGGVTDPVGLHPKYFNRYKHIVEHALASEWCKKILCWTEFTRKSVVMGLDCTAFDHKIEIVPRAVPKKNFTKSYNDDRVKLFFIGSAAIAGEFEARGGKEVLEAFSILSKKYNNLELVIRSDIPKHVKTRYGTLLMNPRITLIEKVIPLAHLEEIYKSVDIFLFLGHYSAWLVFLEAMSYELPVIASDEHCSSELVEHGKTGFIISKHQRPLLERESFTLGYLGYQGFTKAVRTVDPKVVDDLVDKTSLLIENPELRRQMGKAGRWEIEHGKFSIQKQNEQLKRIFDEAIAG
jgi:glycosyltransferase involved in cell wall biosynthesis